jgi:hypothetical protein
MDVLLNLIWPENTNAIEQERLTDRIHDLELWADLRELPQTLASPEKARSVDLSQSPRASVDVSGEAGAVSAGEIANQDIEVSAAPESVVAPPSEKGEMPKSRRALVDAYIKEVWDKKRLKIKRKDIWQGAGFTNPREFQYWQSQDSKRRPNKEAHKNIMRVLTEKPHLK